MSNQITEISDKANTFKRQKTKKKKKGRIEEGEIQRMKTIGTSEPDHSAPINTSMSSGKFERILSRRMSRRSSLKRKVNKQ